MEIQNLLPATGNVPKVIDASTHAVMDYVTAASFFGLGAYLHREHPRAAALAYVNGAAVLGLSMLTDYPGGVFRSVSFRTHGWVDVLLAGMTAAGPAMLGFADEPIAQVFYGQAAIETGIVAATDWASADGDSFDRGGWSGVSPS
jgi:hypothetical protein